MFARYKYQGINSAIVSLLIMIMSAGCEAQSPSDVGLNKESWLRTYDSYVVGIYADAGKASKEHGYNYKNIYVALTQSKRYGSRDSRRISLVSFADEEQTKLGCLYDVGKKNVESQLSKSGDDCSGKLGVAYIKKKSDFDKCEQLSQRHHKARLFITDDLKDGRCLYSTSRINVTKEDGKTVKVDSISWAGDGYLGLNRNRLFDCRSYGRYVEYKMGKYNSSHKSYEYPVLVGKEKTRWKKLYLIKVKPFGYCWNGKRTIDEPESGRTAPAILDDGTALLPGVVSVLRIKLSDGTTLASKGKVSVFKPEEVHNEVAKHGNGCTGDSIAAGVCPLARTKDTSRVEYGHALASKNNLEKDFYPYVIEGINRILTKFVTKRI